MTKAIIFDWFGVCTEDFRTVLARKLHKKINARKEDIIKSYVKYELPITLKKISSRGVLLGMFRELKINKNVGGYLHIFRDKPKLNKEIFKLAKKLKNKYSTFLLSDNFKDMTKVIRRKIRLDNYFDFVIFSNEIGLVKRKDKIYKITIEKLGCRPNECIIIDDKKENIKRARKLGVNGILFRNIKQVKKELTNFNIEF